MSNSNIIKIKTNDFNTVLQTMLKHPTTRAFLNTHELVNRRIFDNECYLITYDASRYERGKMTDFTIYIKAAA